MKIYKETSFKISEENIIKFKDDISYYHQDSFPDGHPWLSLAKVDSCYLFRFHKLVDFLFNPLSREIKYQAEAATSQETINHLFINNVLPLLNHFYGLTVLHSSGVISTLDSPLNHHEDNKSAIVFLGETGQGKSTITGSFCKAGYPMLADDCLILNEQDGQILGYPSNPSLRLWGDSAEFLYGENWAELEPVAGYTTKKRLDLQVGSLPFSDQPAPIRRVYVLNNSPERDNDPSIDIAPLSAQEAFIELYKHSFRLDITDKDRMRKEFQALIKFALYPIFFRLSYPRDYNRLPDVQEAILNHLKA